MCSALKTIVMFTTATEDVSIQCCDVASRSLTSYLEDYCFDLCFLIQLLVHVNAIAKLHSRHFLTVTLPR